MGSSIIAIQHTRMQEQRQNPNKDADAMALSACKVPPFLQRAQTRGHREVRIALPAVPWRQLCSSDRHARAALLAAELAAWQMTGGDVLRSSLAVDAMQAYKVRSN